MADITETRRLMGVCGHCISGATISGFTTDQITRAKERLTISTHGGGPKWSVS